MGSDVFQEHQLAGGKVELWKVSWEEEAAEEEEEGVG